MVTSMSEEYELELIQDVKNSLIGRRELKVLIHHLGKGTPARYQLRRKISDMLKVPLETVYVRLIKTDYGTGRSIAKIHIYDNAERALSIEPAHIIKRNTPKESGENEQST